MKNLPHIIISASAGSGKTYELVRRYLHLLMLGVEPERIAAMTFTRKAAGEFFNRILRRLAELSDGQTDPGQYFRGLEPMPAQWPDFNAITRRLLRHMHRLRLGTLDSFFAAITACFPMELGLPAGARVMAEDDARRALDEALDELMDRVHRAEDGAQERTLLEGYKLGTYGREDKSVLRSLRAWIRNAHQLWLERPSFDAWGQPRAIWADDPGALIWQKGEPLTELAVQLRELGSRQQWSEEGHDKWDAMVEQVLAFRPGLKIEKPLADLLDKCAANWSALQKGSAGFPWHRRKTIFSGRDAELLAAVISRLTTMEFVARCERTQGVARVISTYEDCYHQLVRQGGRLSFADVQRLLVDAQEQVEAGIFNSGAGHDGLWYRLDGRYDHWLFDEFQDTSVQQWQVVCELVDEVIQDTSGRRSFFAVGDTKQSIYMWRRAEPGLFRAVESRYARGKDGLQKRTLARSYRSCQQVLDAVNAVFGDPRELDALLPGCLEGWDFETHTSAKPELRGHAALLFHEPKSGTDDEPAREIVAALLRELRPVERGLSCAVLVKRNKAAAELAEHLRSATGFDVISESRQVPATDNPVTLALLSVLQLAAHPGDTFAMEHLRMALPSGFECDVVRMAGEALAVVQGQGFGGFVSLWTNRLLSDTLDEFSRHRLAQLAGIAAEFDETGCHDIDAFLDFARNRGLRAQGSETAVQVMTIHKSKGLEFDIVILPDLDGNALNRPGAPDLVKKQPLFGRAEWILQMPSEALSQFDPKLAGLKEQLARREGFEGLCQLYVAMTRAKRGLYMISKPPPKTSEGTMNEARLLREQLTGNGHAEMRIAGMDVRCAAQFGDASWFEEHPVIQRTPESPTRVASQPAGELLRRLQPLPRRLTPSEEEAFHITGSTLFAPDRESGRALGSLVHALLAEVDWVEGDSFSILPRVWEQRALSRLPGYDRAATQVMSLLKDDLARFLFARPGCPHLLWRERAFDLMLDGEWISGVMDRVVIKMNDSGNAVSAWLVDFKTDSVRDEEQRMKKIAGYKPQIDLYRRALSKLTGLGAEAIRASLVFTGQPAEVRI